MSTEQFGISTTYFSDERLSEKHFALIEKAGFRFIEIYAGQPHFNVEDKNQIREIISCLKKYNLKVHSLHGSGRKSKGKIIEEIKLEFEALRELGGSIFILHPTDLAHPENLVKGKEGKLYPGHSFMRDIKTDGKPFKWIKEVLEELGSYAKGEKIEIALENMIRCDNNILAGMVNLLDKVNLDNIGFCLDVGHANLSQNTEQMIRAFGEKLITTHIQDNHGSDDEHLLPFSGVIDWGKILDMLQKEKYDGVLMYEVLKNNELTFVERARRSLFRMASLWQERCR